MKKFIKRHKILTGAVLIVLIAGGGYYWYGSKNKVSSEPHYVIETVEKGTLITSISGSGQVSASNQVDVKPKVSGDIVAIDLKSGQEVKAGDALAQIDSSAAQKTVRDAQLSLEGAQISFEKLKQQASGLSLLQAENAVVQARDSLIKLRLDQESSYQTLLSTKQTKADDLTKAYDDGFSTISNAFLDLPNIMSGLQGILYNYDISPTQQNIDVYVNYCNTIGNADSAKVTSYRTDAENGYQAARKKYDKNFDDFKTASRYSSRDTLEPLINETYDTTKSIAEAIKNTNNLIQFTIDVLAEKNFKAPALSSTHLNNLSSYTGKVNSHLQSLLNIIQTIKNANDGLTNTEKDIKNADQLNPLNIAAAEVAIKEKEASLADLKAGADALDIRTQELSLIQRQNALADAQEKLADYAVTAPFDGVIATVSAKKGDPASSGTAIVTMVTKQKVAEISLNEVDIAKVKAAQKATLTFDAVSDLSISGEVAEVASIGTTSQGVVNYSVKIVFDTQDDRIKPSMSVTAAIVTEAKTDILLIPSTALKSSGDIYYVEKPTETIASDVITKGGSSGITLESLPAQQTVQIGSANDTSTEITSGLSEGDQIITKTITAAASTSSTATTSRSLLQTTTGTRTTGGSAAGGFRPPGD